MKKSLLLTLSIVSALYPVHFAMAETANLTDLEQRINDLESRLAATQKAIADAKQEAQIKAAETRKKADETQAKADEAQKKADEAKALASSFEFHGYARAGLNINQDFQGANGGRGGSIGPQMSIGSGLGAYFGRLGLEDDNYVDSRLVHNQVSDNGTKSMYMVMLSAGDETETDWVPASSSSLNVRQVYTEISDLAAFRDSDMFRGTTLWAGKRYDRENFDLDFIDSHVIFLAGTGAGIYDVKMSDNWKTNFSVIGNQYDSDSTTNSDLEGYTFTVNNLIGDHWELMFNTIAANKNNQRTSLSTTYPVPDRDELAQYGEHVMLGYKADSFYGLQDGWSRTGMMYGHAMGAETKSIGQDNHLLKDANSVRFYTMGGTQLSKHWSIAPTLLAEWSKDRYLKGDEYKWVVANIRLAEQFNPNFEIAYESTYQYLDLNNSNEKKNGDVYKFTIAPTFKVSDLAGFFDRPQIRFAVSYVNWSDRFQDSYVINGYDCGMGKNSETVFALQMETWF